MRIVWKDSKKVTAKKKKGSYAPIKYRGHILTGSAEGWKTDIPGDDNLYISNGCAMNATDDHYGDFGQHGTKKRISFGIRTVEEYKKK